MGVLDDFADGAFGGHAERRSRAAPRWLYHAVLVALALLLVYATSFAGPDLILAGLAAWALFFAALPTPSPGSADRWMATR